MGMPSMSGKFRSGETGEQTGWLNVYRLESAPFVVLTSIHPTLEEAERKAAIMSKTPNDYAFIATVKINWYETFVVRGA